jgi:hypothetical protein
LRRFALSFAGIEPAPSPIAALVDPRFAGLRRNDRVAQQAVQAQR